MYKIDGVGMDNDYAAFSGVEGVRSAIPLIHRSKNEVKHEI